MAAVWLILKAALWLLLVLLGLLLLVLLLLLFIPFRYRLSGSFLNEVPDGTVILSWFLHLVTVELTYHHGVCLSGSIRLFGIPIRRIEGVPSDGGVLD